MTTQQHGLHIREWLSALALRCEPRNKENLEVLFRDYAQGLAEMPYETFSTVSREAASRHFEWFPSYKALRAFLEKWLNDNKPAIALPAPDEPTLTDADRVYLRAWQKRRAIGDFPKGVTHSLDAMRSIHPALLAYLARIDDEVATISRNRGRLTPEGPIDTSETGITRKLIELEAIANQGSEISAPLASLGLSILRRNVLNYAPQRLPMLPERFANSPRSRMRQEYQTPQSHSSAIPPEPASPSAREAFKASYGRYPGDLSPEHLKSVRNKLAEDRAAAGLPPTTERH